MDQTIHSFEFLLSRDYFYGQATNSLELISDRYGFLLVMIVHSQDYFLFFSTVS